MLYVLPDSAGDILVVQASENLSQDDFQNIFLNQITKQLKPNHKLRVLLYLDHGLLNIEKDSAWQPENFFNQCDVRIIRMAIVSGPKWTQWSAQFSQSNSHHFRESEFLKALHWLDEPAT